MKQENPIPLTIFWVQDMGKDTIAEVRDAGFAEITCIVCFADINVKWYAYLHSSLSQEAQYTMIINRYIGKTLLTGDLITLWLYNAIIAIQCSRDTMWEKLI